VLTFHAVVVVGIVVVDIVVKAKGVKLFTKFCDEFEFLAGIDLARRVVRIADNDRLRAFAESSPQFVAVKLKP